MSLTFPVDAKLNDGSPVQLVLADNQDIEPLRDLYRIIVDEGTSYPHDRFPDEDAFMDYWFRGKSTVAAYVPDRAGIARMVGAFYLKSNWPGRLDRWRMPTSSWRPTGAIKGWVGCWAPRCCLRQVTRLPWRGAEKRWDVSGCGDYVSIDA